MGQSRVVMPKESKAGGKQEQNKVGQGRQRHNKNIIAEGIII